MGMYGGGAIRTISATGAERSHGRDVGRPLGRALPRPPGPRRRPPLWAPGALAGRSARSPGPVQTSASSGMPISTTSAPSTLGRWNDTIRAALIPGVGMSTATTGTGAFVRQGDEGCKRLPHRARGPGPEHRVNDEIGLIEDAEEGFDVCGAPDRVEGRPGKCPKLTRRTRPGTSRALMGSAASFSCVPRRRGIKKEGWGLD